MVSNRKMMGRKRQSRKKSRRKTRRQSRYMGGGASCISDDPPLTRSVASSTHSAAIRRIGQILAIMQSMINIYSREKEIYLLTN